MEVGEENYPSSFTDLLLLILYVNVLSYCVSYACIGNAPYYVTLAWSLSFTATYRYLYDSNTITNGFGKYISKLPKEK